MSETDIVARLRAVSRVTQFDSAGRLINFEGMPTKFDLEVANTIERQASDLARLREALAPFVEQLQHAEKITNSANAYDSASITDEVFVRMMNAGAIVKAMMDARAALSPATEPK